MEDRHTVNDDGWLRVKGAQRGPFPGSQTWPRCAFYGVFDGHGGSRIAGVASAALWGHVQSQLSERLSGAPQAPTWQAPPRVVLGGGSSAAAASSAPTDQAPANSGATSPSLADSMRALWCGDHDAATASSGPSAPSAPDGSPDGAAGGSAAGAGGAGGLFSGFAAAATATLSASSPPPPSELSGEDLKEIVRSSFERTEAECLEKAKKGRWEDGCTAVTVLLYGSTMIVGNLGDSRAVLCSNGKAVRLSEDHKPNERSELARIAAAGGFVRNVMGIARLQGDLSLSRAFGDQSYKKKPAGRGNGNRSPPPRSVSPPPRAAVHAKAAAAAAATATPAASPGAPAVKQSLIPAPYIANGPLSSIPDVTLRQLSPGADEFLLLACDGVWDVFSDEQAVKIVNEGLKQNGMSPFAAAEHLVDSVLRSARCTDNVTAIVALLRWG